MQVEASAIKFLGGCGWMEANRVAVAKQGVIYLLFVLGAGSVACRLRHDSCAAPSRREPTTPAGGAVYRKSRHS